MSLDKLLADQRERLAEMGYTIKAQWIDHNQAGGLLNGIRIMDARKLFHKALTVQIFDRETVTLSWGFSNDDAVTLTKEDGRLFLEWLRTDSESPINSELWSLIPEGPEPEAPTMAPATNMAKAQLVDYLVANHPDIFGAYGRLAARRQPGEDFYTELLALVKNPERDGRDLARLIQNLNCLARNLYHEANDFAKQGDHAGVMGAVIAAEGIRKMAEDYRSNLADPPPAAQFPEEIRITPDLLKLMRPPTPAPADARYVEPPPIAMILMPGKLAVVSNAALPNANQIGEVVMADENEVTLKFKGGLEVTYNAHEVRPLGFGKK